MSNIFRHFALQDGTFRPKLSYQELWRRFVAMQNEQPIREPGGFDGITQAQRDREILKQEIKNESI